MFSSRSMPLIDIQCKAGPAAPRLKHTQINCNATLIHRKLATLKTECVWGFVCIAHNVLKLAKGRMPSDAVAAPV
jgi:hypothetical protein